MRILQIAPSFYPAWKYGGAVPAVYNLCRELVKRGHQVTVYATDALDRDTRQKEKFVELEGIRVYYFRNLSNRLAWNMIFFSPGMIPPARKEMKAFDIVHLQNYRCFQNIVAHYYAKKYGIPYVLQPRDQFLAFFQKGQLKKFFDITFGYRILKDATMLIAERPSEAKSYQAIGISRDKIRLLPNGVDLTEFANLPQRGKFRNRYALDGKQKIILYLGRIASYKGPQLLVEAFAELAKELEDVSLVIAGPDAGYLPALKRLIKDLRIEERVLLTGPILGKDKLEAYVDADVYVMPSWYEGFSIAPLEAYACGTPVITTDRCGTAEWASDIFDRVIPYDRVRLQQALTEILTQRSLQNRSERQRKSLNLIRERFSWAAITELTEDVYENVLNSGSFARDYE
jgi:glycosyltransferase involved in cell wall biosynthesis